MSEQELNPFAAPETVIEAPPEETADHVLAGRFTRLVAQFVNGFVFAIAYLPGLVMIIMMGEGDLLIKEDGEWTLNAEAIAPIGALFMALGALVILIINLRLLAKYGQSIGKRIMKIKIVMLNGNKASLGRLIVMRWLIMGILSAIPIVGGLISLINILMIFVEDRRCLHDRIAGTKVVKA